MSYKALLVDDEYMILTGLQKIIDWSEYQIEIVGTAANGAEALKFMEEQPVDIVVTDVTMPIMSGIDFVKIAKERNYDFHFIVLSGYEEFDYVRESLVLGAENYLLKPINKAELGQNLTCIIQKLTEAQVNREKDQLFFMSILHKWLNGTIEMSELDRWLADWGYSLKEEQYQVMIFANLAEHEEQLVEILNDYQQPFVLSSEGKIILIFTGSVQKSQLMLRKIREGFAHSSLKLALGEMVAERGEVASSYQHAQRFVELLNFYEITDESCLQMKAKEFQLVNESFSYSFTTFQETLALGKITEVKKEINQLFTEMYQAGLAPQNVTPIIFFILTDILRRFNREEGENYQELLKVIDQKEDFYSLKKLVNQTITNLETDQELTVVTSNVQSVLDIIHQEVQKDLTLKEVSERLHLNAMYLGQLFKKEMKVSFSKYLNQYRIKKAKELLTHTELNINEISAQVGYTSSGYFYKTFKKMTGTSPKEYRLIK